MTETIAHPEIISTNSQTEHLNEMQEEKKKANLEKVGAIASLTGIVVGGGTTIVGKIAENIGSSNYSADVFKPGSGNDYFQRLHDDKNLINTGNVIMDVGIGVAVLSLLGGFGLWVQNLLKKNRETQPTMQK